MILFKLGLLTCAFYVVLTLLLEAGLWAVIYFKGLGVVLSGRNSVLTLGAKFGILFGLTWLISFVVAWSIVYLNYKAHFPFPQS